MIFCVCFIFKKFIEFILVMLCSIPNSSTSSSPPTHPTSCFSFSLSQRKIEYQNKQIIRQKQQNKNLKTMKSVLCWSATPEHELALENGWYSQEESILRILSQTQILFEATDMNGLIWTLYCVYKNQIITLYSSPKYIQLLYTHL